jgi:hypothetical protein
MRRAASAFSLTSYPAMKALPLVMGMSVVIMRDQGAFACAVGTEQAKDFTVFHIEGDAFDGLEVPIFLDDIFNGDGLAFVSGMRALTASENVHGWLRYLPVKRRLGRSTSAVIPGT